MQANKWMRVGVMGLVAVLFVSVGWLFGNARTATDRAVTNETVASAADGGVATGNGAAATLTPSPALAPSVRAPATSNAPPATARAAVPPPLPPADVQLASVVDDLRRRAEAGEAGAACRLAFELQRCAEAPIRAAVHAQYMADHASRNPADRPRAALPASGEARMVDELARRSLAVETTDRVCAGMDVTAYRSPMSWLVLAADRGDRTSRAVLARHSGLFARLNLLANAEALQQFRASAPRWIAEDLASGAPYLYGGVNPLTERLAGGVLLDALAAQPALLHALVGLYERGRPPGQLPGQIAAEQTLLDRMQPVDAATRNEAEALIARYIGGAGGAKRESIGFDPAVNARACGAQAAPQAGA